MSVMKENMSAEAESMPLPSGPAAAAILAAGIGGTFYGIMIAGAEASPALKTWLTWNKGVGPLAGKTGMGVLVFFLSWLVLGLLWKGKSVNMNKVWTVALILIICSLLLTFPPFYDMFAA